jgi:DNA-binding MarR family transcriptional regulator
MGKSDPTVFALLMRAHAVALKAASEMLMETGASPLEAWLLELIPDDGRACASELAEKLGVPVSTVTRMLRRLESHGYMTLTKGHILDARVLRPTLTGLGIMVRKATSGFETNLDAVLLKGIPQNAFAGLLEGLSHIELAGKRYAAPGSPQVGPLRES